ncbi:MAG: M1 family metallopeptidase [Gemmatimonadaceae bacterium]|nr:M1 family metallopeptidase [Gemmatimonadaceae bacterium]
MTFRSFIMPLGFSLLAVTTAVAQSPDALYMPQSVKEAYARGTRSPDGRPGPRYWQNRGRYEIEVTVQPPARTVRGTERITYMNNSPDTLRMLGLKLFMNEHKAGSPHIGATNPADNTSGIHIDAFSVNGLQQQWRDGPLALTNAALRLQAPLAPGDSVRLGFDWHYDLATTHGREGVVDSTTFFVAYFYPRVSVYDDYNGWDMMDFTGSLEFYNDFNDYALTVRAPRNYVAWATGTLANPADVLAPAALGRFQASLASDTTVHVATRADMIAGRITRQDTLLEWRFAASNVSDVAFGVSDHYAWDAGSVVADPASGRRVSVQAAFADSAEDFHHMVRFAGDALAWLSRNWPGVPYPYEKTTVFQGFADMEYPMMVNDEAFADTSFSRFVVAHELAHTWFPFYMGTNESRYPFMDEGWATALEYLYNVSTTGVERAGESFRQFRVQGWIRDPAPSADMPIITPADIMRAGMGNNAYGKPALAYLALKDMLGDSLFARGLHGYMERWHGKHPIPWDFFYSFNDVTGRNLDWFWRRWYFEPNYIDIAVRGVRGRTVELANVGGMPAPFDIVVTFDDGKTERFHRTAEIWRDHPVTATVTLPGKGAIRKVTLDGGIWMDATPADNTWPRQ